MIGHHSGNSRDTLQIVENWHKHLKFPKSSLGYHTGYHLVIDKAGKKHWRRAIGERGAHRFGFNHLPGICMLGNYEESEPSLEQLIALFSEVKILLDMGYPMIRGHQETAPSVCPGKYLQREIEAYRNNPFVYSLNLCLRLWKQKIGMRKSY